MLSWDTQWNRASTYWSQNRLNINRSYLCHASLFPEKRLLLLKCSSMVHDMNNTDFIFSGVICLTLDPVAQNNCCGLSGKDFQLTKAHSHGAHTSIFPPWQLGTWAPLAYGPYYACTSISYVLVCLCKLPSSHLFQDCIQNMAWVCCSGVICTGSFRKPLNAAVLQ